MVKTYSTTAVSGGTVAGAGTFDIGIKRTSGTVVGMMLRRNLKEVPDYRVFDDEYLASQFFTGEPGYGNLPSEKEISILQNDWRSGFGLEVYDASDSKRYRASNGMDLRFRGMAIAGPKATGIALPASSTAATISNGTMEADANWTGGARSSAQAHGGTYSWSLSSAGTSTQDAVTWTTAWQSRAFCFQCWVYAATASQARIAINDGVGTTNSSYHTGDSTWQLLTVIRVLDAAATRLRLTLESVTGTTTYYFDDVTLSYPITGKPITGVDFNDLHYFAMGQILNKLNGTGNGFTEVAVFPATITDLEVMTISGTEYLFIAIGTSNNYWYMTTAEAFTESTATVNDFKYFKLVDAASPTMWGSDGNVTLRSTVNPLNGGTAWSGQTTVDAPSNVITGLFSDAGLLYINKEDKPYYLNSSGAVKDDLAPILSTLPRSTDNGKSANYWLGNFYLPWQQSLLEENAGTLTWRSPNDYSTQLADFVGTVFAVAGDDRYLFAIVDNGTKIEVLAGRSEVIDGTTKWVWHPINETTLTGCESCWVSSVYQKRLWISSTSSSESLYYIPLPVAYGNVLGDANRNFLTSTTFETSWLHGNFRSTVKAFIKLTVEMGHTYDSLLYFTIKYKLLEDTAWTTIGNYTGSAASMIQSRYIPVDAESNNPKSTLFKLQFTAVTSALTILNTDMELNANWNSNANATQSTTQKRGGSYSFYIGDGEDWQNAAPFDNNLRGMSVTWTCYVHCNTANRAQIGINDGVGQTLSSFHTGGSTWEQLTVTRTLDTAATRVRCLISSDGASNSYFDDAAITAPTASIFTPVLLNYQQKAVLYPDQREIIAMTVYCANDILLKDGGQDLESYDTIIATLDEARTATYPVTIYDLTGVVLTGKFLPLPSGVPRWKPITNEANRRVVEREYNLLFQIITTS